MLSPTLRLVLPLTPAEVGVVTDIEVVIYTMAGVVTDIEVGVVTYTS